MKIDKRFLTGPAAANWKGGRFQNKQGYILIRVGKGHHLAMQNGYAREHRVIAEKKIGRRLRPGELVHHRNETRSDNAPKNLLVCKSEKYHRLHHRKTVSLRRAFEFNPIVCCLCGCRSKFLRFDREGRPRFFLHGHGGRTNQRAKAEVEAWLVKRKQAVT